MGWVRYKCERSTTRVASRVLIRSIASSTRSRGDLRLLPIATYAGRQSGFITATNCAPLRRVAGGGVYGPEQPSLQPQARRDGPEPGPPALPAAALEYRSTISQVQDP